MEIAEPHRKRTVNIRRVKPFHQAYESNIEPDQPHAPSKGEDEPNDNESEFESHRDDDDSGNQKGDVEDDSSQASETEEEQEEWQPNGQSPPNLAPAGIKLKSGRVSHPPLRYDVKMQVLLSELSTTCTKSTKTLRERR